MDTSTDEEREYRSLMIRAFGTLAPVYDVMASFLIWARDQVVDFAGAPAGATVLDVATGTGATFTGGSMAFDVAKSSRMARTRLPLSDGIWCSTGRPPSASRRCGPRSAAGGGPGGTVRRHRQPVATSGPSG